MSDFSDLDEALADAVLRLAARMTDGATGEELAYLLTAAGDALLDAARAHSSGEDGPAYLTLTLTPRDFDRLNTVAAAKGQRPETFARDALLRKVLWQECPDDPTAGRYTSKDP